HRHGSRLPRLLGLRAERQALPVLALRPPLPARRRVALGLCRRPQDRGRRRALRTAELPSLRCLRWQRRNRTVGRAKPRVLLRPSLATAMTRSTPMTKLEEAREALNKALQMEFGTYSGPLVTPKIEALARAVAREEIEA